MFLTLAVLRRTRVNRVVFNLVPTYARIHNTSPPPFAFFEFKEVSCAAPELIVCGLR